MRDSPSLTVPDLFPHMVGESSATGEIRTHTVQYLGLATPAFGLQWQSGHGEIRTHTVHVLNMATPAFGLRALLYFARFLCGGAQN